MYGTDVGLPAKQLHVVDEPSRAAALLEPSRLRLMKELGEPASASELSRRIGEPRQRINYHLRELEKAGLVELVEERKRGNCMERVVRATARAYLVSPEVLGSLGAEPGKIQDRLSSAYLVAVCAESIREVGELRGRAERAGKKLPTITLQTEVRFESQDAMNGFASELTEAFTRLAAKYHAGDGDESGRLFKFMVGGYPAITRPEHPPEGAGSDAARNTDDGASA